MSGAFFLGDLSEAFSLPAGLRMGDHLRDFLSVACPQKMLGQVQQHRN